MGGRTVETLPDRCFNPLFLATDCGFAKPLDCRDDSIVRRLAIVYPMKYVEAVDVRHITGV